MNARSTAINFAARQSAARSTSSKINDPSPLKSKIVPTAAMRTASVAMGLRRSGFLA